MESFPFFSRSALADQAPVSITRSPLRRAAPKEALLQNLVFASDLSDKRIRFRSELQGSPDDMSFQTLRQLLALVLLIVAAAAPAIAWGQGDGPGLVAERRQMIEASRARVDALERDVGENAEDDEALVDISLALEDIQAEVLEISVAFRPRLADINLRLEQIGSPPAEGEAPETETVASGRQELQAEKAEINSVIGLAEQLTVRIQGLTERISELRSELFRTALTRRYPLAEMFDSALRHDVRAEFTALTRAFSSWLRFVYQFKFQAVLAAALLAVLAAALLLVGGRRLFDRFFDADPADPDPSYLSRLTLAFSSTLLPTAALAMFFVSTLFFFDYYNVLRGDIGVFLTSLFSAIGVAFGINRLARATLLPRLPNWRLIPVEAGPARWLVLLATAMAVVSGVNDFLTVVNEQMGSPLSLTVARSFIATIVVGALLVLMGRIKPFRDEDGRPRAWPDWLRWTTFGVGGFTMLSAALGFIGLAVFLSGQIVYTGALLLTAYIGFQSARAISAEGGFAETAPGRWLAARYGLGESTLDQLGVLASIAINVVIVAASLPMVLLTWGFQPGDIQVWVQRLAGGFTIGSFVFSPSGIFAGIVVFVAGYAFTKWFQRWLDGTVMARGRVDAGVRNSIRTVVGYVGIALAAIIAISAAGFDLSSLALIAGGLSLGVGFGLQNIVQNFVSGLILLFERPFKAGDWIVAGEVTGTVKKISVRATEIETFQRQTVSVPNSELINRAVGNWTLRNRLGRIDVGVNVAYGSDVRRAHAIMLEAARSHPAVLRNPEPFVLFANFGPAALEFEIRMFLADIMSGISVQNDIRFAVMEGFDRAGIDIPSAPRSSDFRPAGDAAAAAAREPELPLPEPAEAGTPPGSVKQEGPGHGKR